MSVLKKLSLALILFLFILLGALAGVLGTQTGLHWLINSAARWVPGFSVHQVNGGWRGLTLSGVGYQMPGVSVTAGELHLSLQPSCLLHSRLCVNALTAKEIDVVVNTQALPTSAEKIPESAPLTEVSTPYPIQLSLLALKNVAVKVDGMQITLAEFRSGAEWQQRTLTLHPTLIRTLHITLPKEKAPSVTQAVVEIDEPPLGERLKELFARPLLAELADVTLPLDISAARIVGEDLHLSVGNGVQIDRLLLGVKTDHSHIQLQKLEVVSPQGDLSLHGQISLHETWPLNLSLESKLTAIPLSGEQVSLTLSGALKEQVALNLQLNGPVKAQLEGEANLAETGLPLSLTLQSKRMIWPPSGKREYQIDDLRLRLDGKATDYRLSLHSALQGQAVPAVKLTLDGTGDTGQFRLAKLRLLALQGYADLSGVMDWNKAVSWKSVLVLEGINTATQWPEWPAKLQGRLATQGSWYGGNWQMALSEIQLQGHVQQNPLMITGSARGNEAGQWNIPDLSVVLGRNKLQVKGQISDQWALDAKIDAPHLDGALPGLGGVVQGLLMLRGQFATPQVVADLTASRLRWQALQIAGVKLQGNIHAAEPIQGQLAIQVTGLEQESLQISRLDLEAKGSEKEHRLSVNIQGEPVAGHLVLSGRFDRAQQHWQGKLSNTGFTTPVGEWYLEPGMVLDYQHVQQKIRIGAHCWRHLQAELCVPKAIEAGASGEANLILARFDLAMLQPFLGEKNQLAGGFSGQARVHWQAGGLPQAKLSLVGQGVKIQQNVQDKTLSLGFDTLTLDAGLDHGRAQLAWLMNVTDNGQFSGTVQIADPQGRRTLSGNVVIERFSLGFLKPLLVQGEDARGELNADLRLGGNLLRPALFGRLALSQLGIDGKFMPFNMTQGDLALNFDGFSSQLEGTIRTTQGQLNLTGEANWQEYNAWWARIVAKGDTIRITVPPMIRMDISPDLLFEATPQALALNGSVGIPWARIKVQELPESAVTVSSDEVMLNEEHEPIAPKSISIPINSNLMIHIGDDVRLNAFDLKTKLKGDLKVVQSPKGLGLNGLISLNSGRFHAYGQDLIVRKGTLIFSGPPAEPMLDIEAIRNPDATENNVTAGVRVTGLADGPKLDVFSDPAMSQQEALSYLIRGQGLNTNTEDSSMMTSMLIGLGVAKSGKLVGKIGQAFGVSNLSLDTQGVGDKSQVVVSGYLLPGLQVKYGVGIFDSLATLTLRYQLMPKLYLEAVSSLDQALDLLYQFEF